MSYDQWKYGTNFSSYGAFEKKLFKNTFVAFIMKHPVSYNMYYTVGLKGVWMKIISRGSLFKKQEKNIPWLG